MAGQCKRVCFILTTMRVPHGGQFCAGVNDGEKSFVFQTRASFLASMAQVGDASRVTPRRFPKLDLTSKRGRIRHFLENRAGVESCRSFDEAGLSWIMAHGGDESLPQKYDFILAYYDLAGSSHFWRGWSQLRNSSGFSFCRTRTGAT